MAMHQVPKYTPFVLILLLYSACQESFASFNPIDNYLVTCGSSYNITFQGRTFIPDIEFEHSNLQIIRYWIRLYFQLFLDSSPNMTIATIAVIYR
ncbi:receptor-like kinase theseus-like protein, putative [Medicago truncatula]|uniref:Receptor-like kinase theseus-like protein, putative n=1 Tax=Medicago truncatula TaxID=3880 RepID=G7IDG5_MEDTR|nr:receptor-like kinase theseus-like protein, putative [Medicago truncatula]